jgi:hypothetical protein
MTFTGKTCVYAGTLLLDRYFPVQTKSTCAVQSNKKFEFKFHIYLEYLLHTQTNIPRRVKCRDELGKTVFIHVCRFVEELVSNRGFSYAIL